jgi:HAD superfamily hydrolase (TIGR01509 family)
MYTTLIFDMDGLMIDSESLYWAAGREIAKRYGKTCPDALLQNMMGRAPLESVTLFCKELGLPTTPEELLTMRDGMVAKLIETARPMPGLMEALAAFRGKLKMGICTSARRGMVDIVMRSLGIEYYFDGVQTSDGLVLGKPNPEIYLKAMTKLGSRPDECIVLEDSCNGARAGKAAGAYTIAVPSEYTRSQDFSFADYTATDLFDAAGHIRGLTGGTAAPHAAR